MKETEINYKALYEETISRLKIAKENVGCYTFSDVIGKVIPELAESEDEKIREELIEYFKWNAQQILDNFDNKDVIAWLEKQGKNDMGISEVTKQKLEDSLNKALEKETPESWNESLEKQGEQKSTDTPKFKVGDWVVSDKGEVARVVKIGKDSYGTLRYYFEWTNGNKTDPMPCFVDDKFHLWTIQDAKDGDVLITHLDPEEDWIGIYKESCGCDFYTHCFINSVGEFVSNPNKCKKHGTDCVHPATKEQCDLLFQKIREIGYEWDEEKKELKEIKSDSFCSEEDDKVFKAIYEDLHSYYTLKANMLVYDTYKKEYEKQWEDAKKWLEEHVAS